MKVVNMQSFILVFLLTICLGTGEDLVGRVSKSIQLTCPHASECGEIHSIKWYRESERVYVYSPYSQFSNPESFLVGRSSVVEEEGSSNLEITDLQSTDDGNYRCEITYLEVSADCQAVFMHDLVTTAFPSSVVLKLGEDVLSEVDRDNMGDTSTVAGPFALETELSLTCEVLEVKPAAVVTWSVDGDILDATDLTEEELEGGLVSIASQFNIILQREHLGKQIACSVEFEDEKISTMSVELDILVGPSSVDITVPELTEGLEGTLECRVAGALPAVHPTWIGMEEVDTSESVSQETDENGDSIVTSLLTFIPTKDLQEVEIRCRVEHPALAEAMDSPAVLDVLFAPIVTIEQRNLTVIEGEDTEIVCSYGANPLNGTTITWYKDSELLEEKENVTMMMDVEDGSSILLLLEPARGMSGEYYCQADNIRTGQGLSQVIQVQVIFPPEVEIEMKAGDTVTLEDDEYGLLIENTDSDDIIELKCVVNDGNPLEVDEYAWFKDGDLLEDCSECGNGTLVIPAGRESSGNYTCQATNLAGDGEASNFALVIVYYTASAGEVTGDDGEEVFKGGNATLLCELEDLGLPEVTKYAWKKNDEVIEGEEESFLNMFDLGLESEGNFTCTGVNEAGDNYGDIYYLDIQVMPEFLVIPEDTVKVTEDYQWVNLTCQVECYPLCSIEWAVNMLQLAVEKKDKPVAVEVDANEFNDYEMMETAKGGEGSGANSEEESGDYPMENKAENQEFGLFVGLESIEDYVDGVIFVVETEDILPLIGKNQFESVKSTLSLNLGNITREVLDRYQSANFSCIVQPGSEAMFPEQQDNEIAEFESNMFASTMLIIEHAPLDIELTIEDITVEENETIDVIECTADSLPLPQIVWRKDGEIVSETNILEFSEPISRDDKGEYTCSAGNEYGELTMSFNLEVLHVPTCSVSLTKEDDYHILTCIPTDGNPQDFGFWWEYNEHTIEGDTQDDVSVIKLENVKPEDLKDYLCYVNNTMGMSQPCFVISTGEDMIMYIIIAIIAALLILVLVLVILYKCCRNKPGPTDEKAPEKKNGVTNGGDHPKPDSSFYDKLPFHGLKTPPKKVLNTMDEGLIYADVDASETYSYGPVGYKNASMQRAKKKKEDLAQAKIADSKV